MRDLQRLTVKTEGNISVPRTGRGNAIGSAFSYVSLFSLKDDFYPYMDGIDLLKY